MINIVVFSKDRACQLDLFIRSFLKNYRGDVDESVNVIFTYSSHAYRVGYETLLSRHYPLNFIDEAGRRFKDVTESVIDETNPYTVFFVDDNVFKEPFSLDNEVVSMLDTHPEICCASLRMHKGITYCYTEDRDVKPPLMFEDNTWYWEGCEGDWGYPMSLDGHIFRTREILPLIKSLPYRSPNTLEGFLSNNPLKNPKMVCLDNAVILNNPCNKVQTDNTNRHGSVNPYTLNELYIHGMEIAMDNFSNTLCNSPHVEIDLIIQEASNKW